MVFLLNKSSVLVCVSLWLMILMTHMLSLFLRGVALAREVTERTNQRFKIDLNSLART